MRKYIRKADRIDPERGDILQLTRKSVAPLYANGYPQEMRHNIFDSLLGWFVGGEEPSISDPLANSYLQMLIAAQKEEVQKYLDFCRQRADNRSYGVTSVDTSSLYGVTSVGNINNKENKIDDNKESILFSVCEDRGASDAPSASHVELRDTRQTLMMIAPPVDGKHYNEEQLLFAHECPEMLEDPKEYISSFEKDFNDLGYEGTRPTLERYCEELGANMFMRTCFKFDSEWPFDHENNTRSTKKFNNPPGALFSRFKRLKEALEATKAAKV